MGLLSRFPQMVMCLRDPLLIFFHFLIFREVAMQRLSNALKIHAARLDGQMPSARYGVVQSVSAQDCTVKVTMQPEGVLSG